MALMRITSPHAHGPMSTPRVMLNVLLATVPGIIVLTHFFGFGTLVNILWGSLVALACEALALKLRRRPLAFYLKDYSALVTAFLLCIALPPYSPWWLIAVGIASAILLAKHLYGGLGYNPFNPAMAGYVILLISFPVQMTAWAPPRGVGELPGLLEALQACFAPAAFDGTTMATPLDLMKQNSSLLVEDLWRENPQFGRWAGVGWEWANLAFLAGGAWLLYQRIFTWHAPVAMLASLSLFAALFYDGGSSASGGSPLFHLLSGATMFGSGNLRRVSTRTAGLRRADRRPGLYHPCAWQLSGRGGLRSPDHELRRALCGPLHPAAHLWSQARRHQGWG